MSCTARNSYMVTLFSLLLVVVAIPARAATLFTEDFSDTSPNPNMSLGANGGAGNTPSATFAGEFKLSAPDNGRRYLATNDADYYNTSFIFEATLNNAGANSGYTDGFLGMGSGDVGGFPFYPDTPTIALEIQMGAGAGVDEVATFDDTRTVQTTISDAHPYRMRMTWNGVTHQALFELDQNYTGTFAADLSYTINGSDNGFTNGTDARLFVGGGDGIIFDDIVVRAVPEPGSIGLLLLGCFGIGVARRWSNRGRQE